jgi:hypothetical protein
LKHDRKSERAYVRWRRRKTKESPGGSEPVDDGVCDLISSLDIGFLQGTAWRVTGDIGVELTLVKLRAARRQSRVADSGVDFMPTMHDQPSVIASIASPEFNETRSETLQSTYYMTVQ